MSWPAQSTDVNPIENLWDEIDRTIKFESTLRRNSISVETNTENLMKLMKKGM